MTIIAALAPTLLPFHLTFAGPIQTLAPVTDADGRLGLCNVLPGAIPGPNGAPWAQLAYNAGARIDRSEFRWDRIEPRADQWDFSQTDPIVQSARQSGLQVEGILIGTPGWAAAHGQRPGNGVPKGLNTGVMQSTNLWARYVRVTVAHYKGQVGSWEIWNEPDLRFFWTGSPETYYRLLKVAFAVIKDTDPHAQVLMAGMIVPDLAFARRVLDVGNRDTSGKAHHGYFDAVAWHAYGPAKSLYSNILSFRSLLGREGYGNAPLWVTEDGFPSSNPNGEPRQAAYILQTIAYAFAAGATKVLVYRASDDPTPKTWGLMSAAGQPRMSYVAYQVAAHYFAGSKSATYAPLGQAERFALYEPKRRITVLWNRSTATRSVSVPADQPTATLVDWTGIESQIASVNGEFRVSLPGAQYNAGIDPGGSVVGGPPMLLIEDDVPPPNLSTQAYVPAVSGTGSTMVLFNHVDRPATVVVAAASRRTNRVVVQMAPRTMQTVDLTLLAGANYNNLYSVSSSPEVAARAVSSQTTAASSVPSSSWFSASLPQVLTLSNPGRHAVSANVTVFGEQGHIKHRAQFAVPPSGQARWSPPRYGPGTVLSLRVKATGPVVAESSGVPDSVVSQPQVSWYALYPGGKRLAISNPGSTTSRVDLRLIGATPITGEQLQLAAHHSFVIPTEGARAVAVTSSSRVTAAYLGGGSAASPLSWQASTQAAVAAGGRASRVALFNPSSHPAHVSLSLVGRSTSSQKLVVVPPSRITTVAVTSRPGTPAGAVVNSDTPVVAAPSS